MFLSQLHDRGAIALSGLDRVRYLQGLITNDINDLAEGEAVYAALLMPQGKFLFDLFIINDTLNDRFLLTCEITQAASVIKLLNHYKLRAKVEVEDLSDRATCYALWPEDHDDIPNTIQLEPSANLYLFKDTRLAEAGFRVVDLTGVTCDRLCAMLNIDSKQADYELYDRFRIGLGLPDGARDLIMKRSTVQEGNLDYLNAVDWNKGCFTGQELTARIHYRGLIKKRLMIVTVAVGQTPPPHGTFLYKDERRVGEMRSSAGERGLALVRLEAFEPGVELMTQEGESVTVLLPDYLTLE